MADDELDLLISEHYDLSDFDGLNYLNCKHMHQKSVEGQAIMSFILAAGFWFSKGYFTRLGEGMADRTLESYDKLKETIITTMNKKDAPIPMMRFDIQNENGVTYHIYLKYTKIADLIKNFDLIHEIYNDLCKKMRDIKDLKSVTFTLNNDDIVAFFYETIGGKLYAV